jgi:peroxiredoxin
MLLSSGQQAPPAQVRDPGGPAVDLAGLAADRPALVFVFKADCPATDAAAPALPRFAQVPGLAIAAVSEDGAGEAAAFAARHGWPGAVRLLLDPEPWPASDAWGIRSTPTWVLLAPGGRVEAVAEGWSRDDANALAARAAALAGAPAPVVSRPGDGPGFRPG